MSMRTVIVGPGRVGSALGLRLQRAGVDVLGYVARSGGALPEGLGRPQLELADLRRAHVVVFSVGDGDLAQVVAAAAAAGGRSCSLWLHTSGRHDLSVFAPAHGLGLRFGAMHPLLPFPASGAPATLDGAPAVLTGPPESMRLLRRLCELLGLDAIECGAQDRALYHAACALAANGTTALFDVAGQLLRSAGGLPEDRVDEIVAALATQAVRASRQHGAARALSGPVVRGDDETVRRHAQAVDRATPELLDVYRQVMLAVLELARRGGLSDEHCRRVARALSCSPDGR